MTTNQPSLMDEVPRELKPYVKAMTGASGLDEFDAITSVLFAITTHLDLEQYPILVYLGNRATGKSVAMRQLFPMCKDSKWINGRTYATQRDEVKDTRTVFVDEADIIDNNADLTDLYTRRYLEQTGMIKAKVRGHYGVWVMEPCNIFGATVMAKRTPIGDVALRSRAIIIRTDFRSGDYQYTEIGDVSRIASHIVGKVKQILSEIGEVDRVYQTWSSPFAIAKELGMPAWHNKCIEIQAKEAEAMKGGRGYEPSEAILQAIDISSRDSVSHKRVDMSVRISNIVRVVKEEFAIPLKPAQVKEEAEAKGFEAGSTGGYPTIKVKKELLDSLLPEKGDEKGDIIDI